jgi:hypothetical protein
MNFQNQNLHLCPRNDPARIDSRWANIRFVQNRNSQQMIFLKISTHARDICFQPVYPSPKLSLFTCSRLCRRLITSIWSQYKSNLHTRFIICRLLFWNAELLGRIPKLLRWWQRILQELEFNINLFWEFKERKNYFVESQRNFDVITIRWKENPERIINSFTTCLYAMYVSLFDWLTD